MKVGIVGAGITGLALGNALVKRGVDIEVFERSAHVRAGGSGITLAPNGLAALDALGFGERYRALQEQQLPLLGGLKDPRGTWLSRIPAEVTTQSLAISRAKLHELLKDGLPDGSLHTGVEVVGANPETGEIELASGETRKFDLVVGADGINSSVRRSCFDDPGTRYAGYNAWRAIAPKIVGLEFGSETWGSKARFGVVPLQDGSTYWFAVKTGPEAPAGAEETHPDALKDAFNHWHYPIPQLIAATPEQDIQFLPIRELASPLPSYTNGRVVLVGDAAHAMTPNLGQGACQGLEDVAVLADLLGGAGDGTVDDTLDLALYDQQRVKRSQRIARQSRLVGDVAHTGGHRVAWLRNRVLQATPDALTERQTKRVTDWR